MNMPQEIVLRLKVGRIPVIFRDSLGCRAFDELHQVDPVFGQMPGRATVAGIIGLRPDDISSEWPMQTVSAGLDAATIDTKKSVSFTPQLADTQG